MGSYLAEVLPYWRDHIDNPELASLQRYRNWYCRDDGALEARFGDLVATLLAEPTGARDIPNTAATVIVLDQFPRKLFSRGLEAYSGHTLAANIAAPLLDSGEDKHLDLIVRIALAMSLANTEDLAAHDSCLRWFRSQEGLLQGEDLVLLRDFAAIAAKRREIIRLYGRFPPRNQSLGRASTPAEAYFLVGHAFEFE